MGCFTRSHMIPPASANIQCLEAHGYFPWQIPRNCVCMDMCVCVYVRVCVDVAESVRIDSSLP